MYEESGYSDLVTWKYLEYKMRRYKEGRKVTMMVIKVANDANPASSIPHFPVDCTNTEPQISFVADNGSFLKNNKGLDMKTNDNVRIIRKTRAKESCTKNF